MNACVYCGQAELHDRSRLSIFPALVAKGLSIGRTYYELRGGPNFSFRRLGESILRGEELRPMGGDLDRICPFCRRGRLACSSPESVWFDLAARLLGLARVYLELCGDSERPSLSWRELATVVVDGEEASADHVYNARVEVVPDAEHDDDPSGKSEWFGGFGR